MKIKVFVILFLLFGFKAKSQFYIGDSTAQVMLDVVRNKNCSEPIILEHSVFWTNYATNSYCFAFFNNKKRVFKLVIQPRSRESFNRFLVSLDKKYMRNNVGEWFATENEKAYLIKTEYSPESVLKYLITFTQL